MEARASCLDPPWRAHQRTVRAHLALSHLLGEKLDHVLHLPAADVDLLGRGALGVEKAQVGRRAVGVGDGELWDGGRALVDEFGDGGVVVESSLANVEYGGCVIARGLLGRAAGVALACEVVCRADAYGEFVAGGADEVLLVESESGALVRLGGRRVRRPRRRREQHERRLQHQSRQRKRRNRKNPKDEKSFMTFGLQEKVSLSMRRCSSSLIKRGPSSKDPKEFL